MFEQGTKAAIAAVAMVLACSAWGQAQPPKNRMLTPGDTRPRMPAKVTPNFRDISFSKFADAVSQISGRTLVIGRGVCASISLAATTELTGEQFYQEFVSISHALGFIVVEEGSVTTISLGYPLEDSATCGKHSRNYSNRQDVDE
jgi:type II secretory pathway component GspD/PulD (secretin)